MKRLCSGGLPPYIRSYSASFTLTNRSCEETPSKQKLGRAPNQQAELERVQVCLHLEFPSFFVMMVDGLAHAGIEYDRSLAGPYAQGKSQNESWSRCTPTTYKDVLPLRTGSCLLPASFPSTPSSTLTRFEILEEGIGTPNSTVCCNEVTRFYATWHLFSTINYTPPITILQLLCVDYWTHEGVRLVLRGSRIHPLGRLYI